MVVYYFYLYGHTRWHKSRVEDNLELSPTIGKQHKLGPDVFYRVHELCPDTFILENLNYPAYYR